MRTNISFDKTLTTSYHAAEEILKDRATSFYQAFHQLPTERFQGVAAVYAFCRYADDTVDQASLRQKGSELEQLDRLEAKLRAMYTEQHNWELSDDQPWWPAFADTVRRFAIPIDSFLHQIEGQRRDADFSDVQTMGELLEYCRLVAGSVGTMLLPLLVADDADLDNSEFVHACQSLGVGMQITNILRDVGEDLKTRNRIYLPADLLKEYRITRVELLELAACTDESRLQAAIPQSFILLWERLAMLADEYYFEYENWISWFHPSCQIPLTSAALVYRAIADAVRGQSYNCFSKRCYTDAATRAVLIASATKRVMRQKHKLPVAVCSTT